MPKKPTVAMEMRKIERSVDPRITEARVLMPTQRLALLDTIIDESLESLRMASVETWLGRLKGMVESGDLLKAKKLMEFMQDGSGLLASRAKMIAAATQAIREMGNLIRREVKNRPRYEDLIAGMTLDDIRECEDEQKLTALAGASLKRLAERGLLTRQIIHGALDSIPPEIIPNMGPAPNLPPWSQWHLSTFLYEGWF